MPTGSNTTRIAKNTLLLYFRMLFLMAVSLYTSRVILDKLGIEDFGLYNAVGGVVGMLTFLNGTLSNGTMRFLTYELGAGNKDILKKTFSTAFFTHTLLAGLILLIMETGGLWFLHNKLVIPPERLNACLWVFHLSIVAAFISITQVPYTSVLQAHEQMNVYAYISIFEGLANLGICYLVTISTFDKLISYAVLVVSVALITATLYRGYCIKHYEESRLDFVFDKKIFKNIVGFAGWNITANISEMLKTQGVLILINMFLAPVVLAAQAIANRVSNAILQFQNNFRTAINPQIIKLYAAGDYEGSKKLTLDTTVYCFDLILLLGLPAIIVMNKLMDLWLVEVPDYAVVFTQWIIAKNILGTFNATFYVPMLAANKIKLNALAAVLFCFTEFAILYILLKAGFDAMWVQYMGMALCIVFSFFVKPFILNRQISYSFKELFTCYFTCFKVLFLSLLITVPAAMYLEETIAQSIIKIIISALSVCAASYVCLTKAQREKIVAIVKNKIKKNQ